MKITFPLCNSWTCYLSRAIKTNSPYHFLSTYFSSNVNIKCRDSWLTLTRFNLVNSPLHKKETVTLNATFSQSAITCSKSLIETLEQSVKYVKKLTIKTLKQHQWRRSSAFIVNFEHISHLVLVFLLLTCKCRLGFRDWNNPKLFCKNCNLKTFAEFKRKHRCRSVF